MAAGVEVGPGQAVVGLSGACANQRVQRLQRGSVQRVPSHPKPRRHSGNQFPSGASLSRLATQHRDHRRVQERTCHDNEPHPSSTVCAIFLRSGLVAVNPWKRDMRCCSSFTCHNNPWQRQRLRGAHTAGHPATGHQQSEAAAPRPLTHRVLDFLTNQVEWIVAGHFLRGPRNAAASGANELSEFTDSQQNKWEGVWCFMRQSKDWLGGLCHCGWKKPSEAWSRELTCQNQSSVFTSSPSNMHVMYMYSTRVR